VDDQELINNGDEASWVYSVLLGKRWTSAPAGNVKGTGARQIAAAMVDSQFDETLNWKDVE